MALRRKLWDRLAGHQDLTQTWCLQRLCSAEALGAGPWRPFGMVHLAAHGQGCGGVRWAVPGTRGSDGVSAEHTDSAYGD